VREKLAALQIAASNGVLFVEDADRVEGTPVDIGDAAVTAGADFVIATVRHSVDGLVSVSVFLDDDRPELPVAYFEGPIVTSNGRLIVRDVPGENRITIYVPVGPSRVRIYADADKQPGSVEILVQEE
jgi:hypothetical protein